MAGTAIRSPSDDLKNHTTVLTQLKEIAETGLGIRGNPASAYVKISDLVAVGLINYISGVISPAAKAVATGGGLTSVAVLNSITGDGTVGTPIQLVGDTASPGNTMLYGTNGSGTKGWYVQPAGGGGGTNPFNVTPDTHPALPTGVGLGPNDDFETGATIDTTGARYAGATPWTAYNLSSGSAAVSNGSLALLPAAIVGLSVNGYTQPLVGATWAYTCKMQVVNTTGALGMIISVGAGKMWHFNVASSTTIEVQSFNTATSFNGTAISTGILSVVATAVYLRIGYDGTNLTFSYSTTGNESSYITLVSTTLTGWLGVAPTLVGLAGQLQSATQGIAIYDWFRRTA